MNFTEFKNQVQDKPFILSRDLNIIGEDPQTMRNQLGRWQKKGLIVVLKKGHYVLNEHDRKIDLSQNVIANICCQPSYVSLETALNYYGLIPEQVADITSVTTRKTMYFKNQLGYFVYQHVQPKAFRGFRSVQEGPMTFFMAEPEKAVVDFLYFNLSKFNNNVKELLEDSYRFQNTEGLDRQKIIEFGKMFNNKKLMRVIKVLCVWLRGA